MNIRSFTNRHGAHTLLFGVTIFISSALLFSIQPMIAKMLLPLLGGTPAVWNTCMLFFQPGIELPVVAGHDAGAAKRKRSCALGRDGAEQCRLRHFGERSECASVVE
jgi:hypothetical protein